MLSDTRLKLFAATDLSGGSWEEGKEGFDVLLGEIFRIFV